MSLTYSAAVEQTITAGEQIHQIVNGTAITEVTVEDGSKVPSIRKALLDNFYFKDPIAWQVGQTENVFNQLRQFTDGSWWYAPSATASNPISMGSTPVGDPLWKIYDFDAIGKLTPQLREALRRSYAEAGYNLVDGSFEEGGILTSASDVLLHKTTAAAYAWSGAFPKVVNAGSTPATSGGIGAGAWVDRTGEALRKEFNFFVGSIVNVLNFIPEQYHVAIRERNSTIDVSLYIQSAIDYAQSFYPNIASVYVPAGKYIITATSLDIYMPINFYGDGALTQFEIVSSVAMPAIYHGYKNDNGAFRNCYIGDFIINSSGSAVCDGIYFRSGETNAANTQIDVNNICLTNIRDGMTISGVTYMNKYHNIVISGVSRYGWVCRGSKEIVYNTFENLEVTNVSDGAYAYFFGSSTEYSGSMGGATFKNLTADGVSVIQSYYGTIESFFVEGIYASTPASSKALSISGITSLKNVGLINIPNAKCDTGIYVGYCSVDIQGVRIPSGSNAPSKVIDISSAAIGGSISDVWNETSATKLLIESYVSANILSRFTIVRCPELTNGIKRTISGGVSELLELANTLTTVSKVSFSDTTWSAAIGTSSGNLNFYAGGKDTLAAQLWENKRFVPASDYSGAIGDPTARWNDGYIRYLHVGGGTTTWTSGPGTPEGNVSAVVGSLYTRTDGGAGTTLYIKESGTGKSGWVAK